MPASSVYIQPSKTRQNEARSAIFHYGSVRKAAQKLNLAKSTLSDIATGHKIRRTTSSKYTVAINTLPERDQYLIEQGGEMFYRMSPKNQSFIIDEPKKRKTKTGKKRKSLGNRFRGENWDMAVEKWTKEKPIVTIQYLYIITSPPRGGTANG